MLPATVSNEPTIVADVDDEGDIGIEPEKPAKRFASSRIPLRRITFVTGNPKKLDEFKQIIGPSFGIPLEARNLDLPELQGASCEEIIREKCRQACRLLQPSSADEAIICEDTSLCFNALNGLPGAYVKWFLKANGPEGLHAMLNGFNDYSGYAQCIFAFYGPSDDSDDEGDQRNSSRPSVTNTKDGCTACHRRNYAGSNIRLFTGRCNGTIVQPRGKRDFGWDPCFQPDYQPFTTIITTQSRLPIEQAKKTFAEMSAEEKNACSHRAKALDALKTFLVQTYCKKQ